MAPLKGGYIKDCETQKMKFPIVDVNARSFHQIANLNRWEVKQLPVIMHLGVSEMEAI